MDHLLSSKSRSGAEATGGSRPGGRQVSGDTDWKMKAEVLSYSRSRGAFIGIDLNGAVIKQDKTRRRCSRESSSRSRRFYREVPAPPAHKHFWRPSASMPVKLRKKSKATE